MTRSRRPKQYLGVLAQNPPNTIVAQRAPASSDTQYYPGDLWVDQTDLSAFVNSAGGTWIAIGTGATGGVVTLTGTSGGAISPSAGNINILGTANQMAFAGSGSTLTGSLSSTLVLPGTLTVAGTTLINTTGTAATTIGNSTHGLTIAAGGLTVTAGGITETNGNLTLATAGNKLLIKATSSATCSAGQFTLAGAATTVVSNSAVTAASLILLTTQVLGTVTAASTFAITGQSAGVSFTVTPSQSTDTSVVNYLIIN